MGSTYFLWIVIAHLTGSPLGAAAALLIGAWLVQRYSFGFSGLSFFRAWKRANALKRTIAVNPHDRTARFELAEMLIARGKHRQAAEVLRSSLALDHDDETLFVMGVASYGAGDAETAERLLQQVGNRTPEFRQGAVWLELGRGRLARNDAVGARPVLQRFVDMRTSTIEGRYLLGRALSHLGETSEAASSMRAAWAEYASAPVFLKRRERVWAYRANPARMAALIVLIVACTAGAYAVLRSLASTYAIAEQSEEE